MKKLKEYLSMLKTVGLFKNIDSVSLETMLKCLGAEIKEVCKNEIILLAGSKPEHVGIVLNGQLHIVKEDYNGNRLLITVITTGGIFAEALCCAGVLESPVTVVADVGSVIMSLSFSRILHTCPNSCAFHTKLIENMLRLIANKNLQLQSRIEIICLKSIRAKILHYLKTFIQIQGTEITIPFNREEMADFLNVDRSALSHELMRMKKDGLINFNKNKFIITNIF